MHNDYRNVNRTEWKFIYKGAQLLEAARRKHTEFLQKEKSARETIARLMVDMSVSQSDSRIADCKSEIADAGTEREKCAVWVHEFARSPEREYFLQLGDVAYFELFAEPEPQP